LLFVQDPYETEETGWTDAGHYVTGCSEDWISLRIVDEDGYIDEDHLEDAAKHQGTATDEEDVTHDKSPPADEEDVTEDEGTTNEGTTNGGDDTAKDEGTATDEEQKGKMDSAEGSSASAASLARSGITVSCLASLALPGVLKNLLA
jgi:hypothetical protein